MYFARLIAISSLFASHASALPYRLPKEIRRANDHLSVQLFAWDTVASPVYLNKREGTDTEECQEVIKGLEELQQDSKAKKDLMVESFQKTGNAHGEAAKALRSIPPYSRYYKKAKTNAAKHEETAGNCLQMRNKLLELKRTSKLFTNPGEHETLATYLITNDKSINSADKITKEAKSSALVAKATRQYATEAAQLGARRRVSNSKYQADLDTIVESPEELELEVEQPKRGLIRRILAKISRLLRRKNKRGSSR